VELVPFLFAMKFRIFRSLAITKSDSQKQATRSVCIAVLALDRPDAGLIFFEWIDVHHPI